MILVSTVQCVVNKLPSWSSIINDFFLIDHGSNDVDDDYTKILFCDEHHTCV